MSELAIKAARSNQEIQDVFFPLVRAEGWNPGKVDPNIFIEIAPESFFLASLNKPIGCCAAIPYDNKTAFIGYYIVDTEYRGKGYGIQIFRRCMEYLKDYNVGLYAVDAQVENYKKFGFQVYGQHKSYRFQAKEKVTMPEGLVDINSILRSDLIESDAAHTGMLRSRLFGEHAHIWHNPEVFGYAIKDGNKLSWALCRPQNDGYRIGPLYAENDEQATKFLEAFLSKYPIGTHLSVSSGETDWIAEMATRYTMSINYNMTTMFTGENTYSSSKGMYAMWDEGMG